VAREIASRAQPELNLRILKYEVQSGALRDRSEGERILRGIKKLNAKRGG